MKNTFIKQLLFIFCFGLLSCQNTDQEDLISFEIGAITESEIQPLSEGFYRMGQLLNTSNLKVVSETEKVPYGEKKSLVFREVKPGKYIVRNLFVYELEGVFYPLVARETNEFPVERGMGTRQVSFADEKIKNFDADADGLSNLEEVQSQFYPWQWLKSHPGKADSDGDGIYDKDDKSPGSAKKDTDNDGIYDKLDNCPGSANSDQRDLDEDKIGDRCDLDADGDGNCVSSFEELSKKQIESLCRRQIIEANKRREARGLEKVIYVGASDFADRDPKGSADEDADGVTDKEDNCPKVPNNSLMDKQLDTDRDRIGDACDDDDDNDGIKDPLDPENPLSDSDCAPKDKNFQYSIINAKSERECVIDDDDDDNDAYSDNLEELAGTDPKNALKHPGNMIDSSVAKGDLTNENADFDGDFQVNRFDPDDDNDGKKDPADPANIKDTEDCGPFDAEKQIIAHAVDETANLNLDLGDSFQLTNIAVSPDDSFVAYSANLGSSYRYEAGAFILDENSPDYLKKFQFPIVTFSVLVKWQSKLAIFGRLNGDIDFVDISMGPNFGKTIKTVSGHKREVSSLILSADGKSLFSADLDGSIIVWNLDETSPDYATKTLTLSGHNLSVLPGGLAVSSDSKLLVSAGSDRSIKLWNLDSLSPDYGTVIKSIDSNDFAIYSVDISADSKRLVSADTAGLIKIFNLDSSSKDFTKELIRLKGHSKTVTKAIFSSDAKRVFSSSLDGSVRIWDSDSESINYGLQIKIIDFKAKVFSMSLSADERNLIISSDRGIKRIGLDHKKLCVKDDEDDDNDGVIDNDDPFSREACAFSDFDKDRKVDLVFGICDQDSAVQWDYDKDSDTICANHPVKAELKGHGATVNDLLLAEDRKQIISASADKTIKIWDFNPESSRFGEAIHSLSGHQDSVNAILLSKDQKLLVSASSDDSLKIWNFDSSSPDYLTEIKSLKGHKHDVRWIRSSLDAKELYSISSGLNDSSIKVWNFDPDSDQFGKELLNIDHDRIAFAELNFDGKSIWSSSTTGLKLWNVNPFFFGFTRQITSLPPNPSLTDAKFSKNGSKAFLGGADGFISVFDTALKTSPSFLFNLKSAITPNPIQNLLITADEKTLISFGLTGVMEFWDISDPDYSKWPKASKKLILESGEPVSPVLSGDKKTIIYGSGKNIKVLNHEDVLGNFLDLSKIGCEPAFIRDPFFNDYPLSFRSNDCDDFNFQKQILINKSELSSGNCVLKRSDTDLDGIPDYLDCEPKNASFDSKLADEAWSVCVEDN